MKRVKIAASAQADLDEIWLFIANDSPRAADRFHDLLHSKFVALAKQPLMGRARDELCAGLRSFPVGSYVIYYCDTPKLLEIARVLHGALDLDGVF
jgi:toxin ParE1/3/4